MITHMPATRHELAEIYGIGAAKLEKYGDIFLEILNQHRQSNNIKEQASTSERVLTPALCRNGFHRIEHKTFVCLATSRKQGGYCVAGKEWSNEVSGPWIRPVSEEATGELSIHDIRLNNGHILQLLDIVQVPVKKRAYHHYQKENVLTAQGWEWKGKCPAAAVSGFRDDVASLWMNSSHSTNGLNDRIPEDIATKEVVSSLYFIKPQEFCIDVSEEHDGRKKVRGRFIYKSVSYLLAVTDPDIERLYILKDVGQYPLAVQDLYLTISLGEPFNGFCYKLIAGIIAR
jgi:hypothetical protein